MSKLVNKISEWKPVNLGPGDFEGLIGVEELVEYEVESGARKRLKEDINEGKIQKKKRKKTKKNVFKVEDAPVAEDEKQKVVPEDLLPWENVCVPEEISRSLVEMGFMEPTEIQRMCIPAAIKGRRDILGAAETGSGKTLAFGIPMLYGILKNKEKEVHEQTDEEGSEDDDMNEGIGCVKVENLGFEKFNKKRRRLLALVVTPTRELAIQVKDHLEAVSKYTGIKVAVIVGGLSSQKQMRILNKEPEIVVGTPGRLWEYISGGHPHMSDPRSIKFLAIDETDRMVERDHYPELRSLLESINSDSKLVKKRQNFVFSATLTLVHEPPKYIKKKKRLTQEQKLKNLIDLVGMTDYKVVDITREKGTAETLKEAKISCTFDEKDFYLYYFLVTHPGRTLVFCNSISCVRRLASLLHQLNKPPLPLHANMMQRQRLKNLDKFRTRENCVLLATDVAARGLDIPSVKHVIHYQVPRTSEAYVHRSGRTARCSKDGLTVLLVSPQEINLYTRLCMTLNRERDLEEFTVDMEGMKRSKEIVKIAREIDFAALKMKRNREKSSWFDKAAEEMDIVIDNDDRHCADDEEMVLAKKFLENKRKELKLLMGKPIVRKKEIEQKKNTKQLKLFKKK